MPGFTPAQTLNAWEQAQGRHAVDRALTLLWSADPEQDYAGLARLPLGERNARLIELHALSFGGRLMCSAECPSCGEALEFNIESQDLLASADPVKEGRSELVQQYAGGSYRVRPINSLDLAAVSGLGNIAVARQMLIERCVNAGQADSLPYNDEAFITTLSEALAAVDPLADITFELTCPQCGSSWQAPFEPAEFLWAQVRNCARRLLIEVHTLAQAYGWSEAEILSLSPARRQAYIEMIPAGAQYNA